MSQRKSISKATRLKVYEKYDGHCAYCGCTLELKDMQVDHIQSVYWYNGANDIENYNIIIRLAECAISISQQRQSKIFKKHWESCFRASKRFLFFD